jgi:CheY-like chemotaxis protein/glycine cleavage system H lipoate-binding protein
MGERILAIDDERVVLDAIRKALRQSDLETDTAQSAAAALQLLTASSYKLVITDLMMPGMDGLQLLRRIRDMGVKTAAIMITGYPSIQTALYAKRLGAFEYVTKPFTRQELNSVVIRAIRAGAVAGPQVEGAPPPEAGEPVYYLPAHSWAKIEPDGTVRLGMARAFAFTVGEIARLQLPAKGDLVEQGRVCAVVHATDGVDHSIHSPLSGTVLEVNAVVLENPSLAGRDPEHLGWLLRLMPQNLDAEIPNLSPA